MGCSRQQVYQGLATTRDQGDSRRAGKQVGRQAGGQAGGKVGRQVPGVKQAGRWVSGMQEGSQRTGQAGCNERREKGRKGWKRDKTSCFASLR
jgi:hypothetical protein